MAGNDKIQILCYGDSNTWGCIGKWVTNDKPSERYDTDIRWPMVLQTELGDAFHVIEEGLGGRTSIYAPEEEPWKNGEPYLKPCLRSHRPLDLVVIMLGTNDLQAKKDISEQDLPTGISRLVEIIQADKKCGRNEVPPQILILAPIEVRPSAPEGRTSVFLQFRCEIGRQLSLRFPAVYEQVAREKGCYFLNAQQFAQPGPADGIHMDAASHVALGKAVAGLIREKIYPKV